MELKDLKQNTTVGGFSPTLGDLIKCVRNSSPKNDEDEILALPQRTLQFVLSFDNLRYDIQNRKTCFLLNKFMYIKEDPAAETKTILNDISGEARDGEIMGILGTSGSGKSTLIDALASRIEKGSLKGSITLNGKAMECGLLKVISAYVMQDDVLFPMLTVEETFMFSAEFRLPRLLSKEKKKARVRALVDQLGLTDVANTIIGDEGHRGVSGGERRRVSIGIDIIHEPIILFLDEPTSGLDCTSAFMVVKVLQRIAQSGSIVITSIHQPSYRILGLLDRLIILSRGQTVYSGSAASVPLFFAEFGHSIPENVTWSEFALDLIHELEESPDGTKSLIEFNKSWQAINHPHTPESNLLGFSLTDAISASISRGKLVSRATSNDTSPASTMATFANPFWIEIVALSKRSITNSRRMPEMLLSRLGTVMVTALILATAFCQLDNSARGVQERLGFFEFALSAAFYFCADALPVFLQERHIFMRETANNAYRQSSYAVSKSMVAIPPLIFLSAAFAATTFWALGLAGGISGFVFFFLMIFASFWAGTSFVTFLSAVVSDVMIGCTMVISIIAYFLIFSGFSINRNQIPPYFRWLHYLSLAKYSFQAMLQNEFEDQKCFMRGAQIFENTPFGAAPSDVKINMLKTISTSLGFDITNESCITTGSDILRRHEISNLSKWSCLWISLAYGFFFRILFYFSLLLGSKIKRR